MPFDGVTDVTDANRSVFLEALKGLQVSGELNAWSYCTPSPPHSHKTSTLRKFGHKVTAGLIKFSSAGCLIVFLP